ncbi:MAG TPA: N-formylglutamate amidohydrolase [Polyangiaceae bacterium]|jgi:N-formylglutamate amidohydrolase
MGARPYEVHEPPTERESPVLVEVPHAGLLVPPDVLGQIDVPASSLARDADLFVHDLYADAPLEGATLLVATHSRYVVDLNRAEDDIDAESVEGGPSAGRAPRGVIWRLSGEGVRVFNRPIARRELESRLANYHRPYHAEVQRILARKKKRFGVAVVLAAHSMPSHARWSSGQIGPARADVVPGTRGRTTAADPFIDAVETHARGRGWSVLHDEPYRGGFTTSYYGRPHDAVHAVQIELARRLYMEEDRLVPHTKFPEVRDWCRALVATLSELALR